MTIFGESAGGWSVEALLFSRRSHGLFHKDPGAQLLSVDSFLIYYILVQHVVNNDLRKAICQSGATNNPFLKSAAEKDTYYQTAFEYFGVSSMVELKELWTNIKVEELITFYAECPATNIGFVGISSPSL